MRVLIIEPHPDDTALSAFFIVPYLQRKSFEISLGSVSSFPETMRSSKGFCDVMGITHIPDNFVPDINFKDNRVDIHALKRHSTPVDYQNDHCREHFSDRCGEILSRVSELINSTQPDVVITVLGITHPMHLLVRMLVDELWGGKKFYFADTPYQFRRYGQHIINDSVTRLGFRQIFESEHLVHEVQTKLHTFELYYPTERQLLRFDRELYYHHTEKLFA